MSVTYSYIRFRLFSKLTLVKTHSIQRNFNPHLRLVLFGVTAPLWEFLSIISDRMPRDARRFELPSRQVLKAFIFVMLHVRQRTKWQPKQKQECLERKPEGSSFSSSTD